MSKSITQDMRYRQSLMQYVAKYGVSRASRKYNKSRSYIYYWKARWDGSVASLACQSRRPHHHPNQHTAAEVIVERADHTKDHMGLTSWRNAPEGKIVKADVSVAKNYLSKGEMQELNEIVTMYLDYAARQARRHIPMTMADWAAKLDAFLQFNDAEILHDKGKVTAAIAKAFAESEFEQYRILQDRLYQSDFDRLVAAGQEAEKEKL